MSTPKVTILQDARDKARSYQPVMDEPEGPPSPPDEPPPGPDPDDEWQAFLPPGFPVVALGVQGTTCFFLDSLGQLISFAWKDVARANIEGMLGTKADLLEEYWPRLDDKGRTKGWKPEEAGRAFKASAAARGVWSPTEKVRGAGSWLGPDGELIIHYGTRVVSYPVDGQPPLARDPGLISDLVFPSRPALPQPATEREASTGAGAEILADLRTWNWVRSDVDPYLTLGHLVAGVLGGALKWRPLAFPVGEKGTGKSTLIEYFVGMLGRWLVSTSDTTGAGVWQKLGYDSRPVLIDEAEGEDDDRRMRSLLALGRQAASGGVVLRGGADHEGREFTARSTFTLAATTAPPLNSADRSRFVILQLLKLADGAKPPDLTARRLEKLGRRLLRRIVDQWPRFNDTLALYREAMMAAGHTARGADVFGTLLACQDLVRFDVLPDSDSLDEWSRLLKVGDLAELQGDMSIQFACLLYLLTQRLESYRGGVSYTIGEWIKMASDYDALGQSEDARKANDVLKPFGLEVRPAPKDKATGKPKWPGLFLWVANRHTALAKLWDGTKWKSGADTQGGWVQHLLWLDGAQGNVPFWSGVQTKATLIPIDVCLKPPPEGGDASSSAAGGSPGTGASSETSSDMASHRSAADTAFDLSAPTPSSPPDHL